MTPVVWGIIGTALGVGLVALVHGRTTPAVVLDTSAGAGHAPKQWTPIDYLDTFKIGSDIGSWGPDLLLIMKNESDLNPAARYPALDEAGHSLAVGISQLTAASDAATGLSEAKRDALSSKSVAEQLPYVRRSFEALSWTKAHRPYPNAGALYAMNFLPARAYARGIAPQTVLGTVDEFPLDKGLADSNGNYTVASLNAVLRKAAKSPRYLGALQVMRDAVGDQTLSPRLA